MANGAWSEKVVQLLRRMNSFYFPGTMRPSWAIEGDLLPRWLALVSFLSSGSCRPSCLRFEVDGAHVGWIPPRVAALLSQHPQVFEPPRGGAVSLCAALDSHGRRSQAVDAVLQAVRRENRFTCLRGWRDEVGEQEGAGPVRLA